MKISELGEKALIKHISQIVAKTVTSEMVGIGDDAAITQVSQGSWLVTSKDLLVEGVHFLLPGISAEDLGYKALAVNLSDLAAMGSLPRHVYVALALPAQLESEFVLAFYQGLTALAERFGVAVSGGDTVASPGPLVISITAQGEVKREAALLRSGAQPGDILCTTGLLGASAAGLLLLQAEINCPLEWRQLALQAHFRPWPRVAEGLWLAQQGVVTAALDLSDGLLKDVQEICEASGCGVLLREEKVPIHPAVEAIAPLRQIAPITLALNGGEDYELLFTVKSDAYTALAKAYLERFQAPLYSLGEMIQERTLQMITKEGNWEKLEFTGYQHF
ncbi:MAG TPA: thiamine-phosphate kinase [Oscillospiraceae bacterium]|nr:thiamine-phosphate kinase [Oscillospiraceae bacterium]